ncbi:hypothetical protein I7I48_02095 [Histoplasma ohiense]|nr:hypothetical protein I7I48_02095 [Histoplasma ohiense (nom. inval.)]
MDADDAGITGPSGSMFPELFQNWREYSAGGFFLCSSLYDIYDLLLSVLCICVLSLNRLLVFPSLLMSDVKPAKVHPTLVFFFFFFFFFRVIPLYLRQCSALGL